MTKQPEICEGDKCPECEEGKIVADMSRGTFYLKCDNCGAMWNDRGKRVAVAA